MISGKVRTAFAPGFASPGFHSGLPAHTLASQPNISTLFAPGIEIRSHRNGLFTKVSGSHREARGGPAQVPATFGFVRALFARVFALRPEVGVSFSFVGESFFCLGWRFKHQGE